jgi:hypothetical protein
MEIKINIEAKGLEEAVHALANAFSNVPVAEKPAATISPAPAETPTQEPAQQAAAKEPEPAPAPETKQETPSVTMDTVRVKLAELSQQGKQAQVKDLITSFGAKRLSDIPEDKYGELLEKASEL